MKKQTAGIHHITAIVSHPQENIDFYAGVLGLRMVKQTVNFDDPGTYHLYFGNEGGEPGTIITFFPWESARKGRIGGGQVGITSYVVPKGSFGFWKNRFNKFNIAYKEETRFGEELLSFEDTHGLQLELVERAEGKNNDWNFGEVTPEVAIKGFGGAVLYSVQPENTMHLLEHTMGMKKVGQEGMFVRYQSTAEIGNIVDVKIAPQPRGAMGSGTVHHIAWRAKDDEDQLEWQEHVSSVGYMVTSVKDRQYFNAIYFREDGEILFEIATDPPGFSHDESHETMGEKLMLPAWYEPQREEIEKLLLPIEVRDLDK